MGPQQGLLTPSEHFNLKVDTENRLSILNQKDNPYSTVTPVQSYEPEKSVDLNAVMATPSRQKDMLMDMIFQNVENSNRVKLNAGFEITTPIEQSDKFIDKKFGFDPTRDNEDFYYEQDYMKDPWYVKYPSNVARFFSRVAVGAATKIGEVAGYIVRGAWEIFDEIQSNARGLENNAWTDIADNSFSKVMQNAEQSFKDQIAPVYRQAGFDESGFFSKMSNYAFWNDSFADAVSFLVSALVPGLAASKLGLLAIGASEFATLNRATFGAAKFLTGSETLGEVGLVAYNTASEAAFEAADTFRQNKTKLKQEKLQGKNNYSEAEMDNIAGGKASSTFGWNMAALTFSNAWEMKNIIKPILGRSQASSKLSNLFFKRTGEVGLKQGSKFLSNKLGKRLVYYGEKGLAATLTEGYYEENIQLAIQRSNLGEYSQILKDGSSKISKSDNVINQYFEQLKDSSTWFGGEGDQEASDSIGLGALIGIFGGSASSKLGYRVNPQTGKKSFFLGDRQQEELQTLVTLSKINNAHNNAFSLSDVYNEDGSVNKALLISKLQSLKDFNNKLETIQNIEKQENVNVADVKVLERSLLNDYIKNIIKINSVEEVVNRFKNMTTSTMENSVVVKDPIEVANYIQKVGNIYKDVQEKDIQGEIKKGVSYQDNKEINQARKDTAFALLAQREAMQPLLEYHQDIINKNLTSLSSHISENIEEHDALQKNNAIEYAKELTKKTFYEELIKEDTPTFLKEFYQRQIEESNKRIEELDELLEEEKPSIEDGKVKVDNSFFQQLIDEYTKTYEHKASLDFYQNENDFIASKILDKEKGFDNFKEYQEYLLKKEVDNTPEETPVVEEVKPEPEKTPAPLLIETIPFVKVPTKEEALIPEEEINVVFSDVQVQDYLYMMFDGDFTIPQTEEEFILLLDILKSKELPQSLVAKAFTEEEANGMIKELFSDLQRRFNLLKENSSLQTKESIDIERKKQALKDIMAATQDSTFILGTEDGTLLGDLLNLDENNNVVLTRFTDTEDGILKGGEETSPEELKNIAGTFGTQQIATSAVEGGLQSFNAKYKVEFKIPLNELIDLVKEGYIVFAGLGNKEFVLSPHIAKKFLSTINGVEQSTSSEQELEAKKADIEIGKIANTEYEVKADGVYHQNKKLDNPGNKKTHKQLIEADIERRRQEELAKIIQAVFPNTKLNQIVYHGTRTQERFENFDENKIGELDSGYFGRGFYFSPDIAYAEGYSKSYNGYTIAAILNLQNPLETDANKANTNISLDNNDGAIVRVGENLNPELNSSEYDANEIGEVVVKNAKQIHILSEQELNNINKINAKYDAELAALEQPTVETPEISSENITQEVIEDELSQEQKDNLKQAFEQFKRVQDEDKKYSQVVGEDGQKIANNNLSDTIDKMKMDGFVGSISSNPNELEGDKLRTTSSKRALARFMFLKNLNKIEGGLNKEDFKVVYKQQKDFKDESDPISLSTKGKLWYVAVVADKEGNILKFNEDGQVDKNGYNVVFPVDFAEYTPTNINKTRNKAMGINDDAMSLLLKNFKLHNSFEGVNPIEIIQAKINSGELLLGDIKLVSKGILYRDGATNDLSKIPKAGEFRTVSDLVKEGSVVNDKGFIAEKNVINPQNSTFEKAGTLQILVEDPSTEGVKRWVQVNNKLISELANDKGEEIWTKLQPLFESAINGTLENDEEGKNKKTIETLLNKNKFKIIHVGNNLLLVDLSKLNKLLSGKVENITKESVKTTKIEDIKKEPFSIDLISYQENEIEGILPLFFEEDSNYINFVHNNVTTSIKKLEIAKDRFIYGNYNQRIVIQLTKSMEELIGENNKQEQDSVVEPIIRIDDSKTIDLKSIDEKEIDPEDFFKKASEELC